MNLFIGRLAICPLRYGSCGHQRVAQCPQCHPNQHQIFE
jgi:hypothetical protein